MIALVDCNNFFASCERLFRPDLSDKPVLVLSNNDGCVVARSNEVRSLDIPMGVPYFKVRDIIETNKVYCFSSNFALYSNISQRIVTLLQKHVPQIEVYSIDEAFLNLNELPIDDFNEWGEVLRKEVLQHIGMPVSVGIAPTKTLAKLASAYAKKHQNTCVLDPTKDPQAYQKVLSETAVEAIWGVGRRLAPRLQRVGIRNALQLTNTSTAWLSAQFGINGVRMQRELCGVIAYPFEDLKVPQKSLMASRSFGHTIKNIHQLETAVASFASQAAYRLRKNQQTTAIFGVYLRFRTPDGQIKGASVRTSFPVATNDTGELVHHALELMNTLYDEANGYKKAGVFASNLQSANLCQADLLDVLSSKERDRRKKLMRAIDSVNARYGEGMMHVASIDPLANKWHGNKKRISPAYTTDWTQLPLVYAVK